MARRVFCIFRKKWLLLFVVANSMLVAMQPSYVPYVQSDSLAMDTGLLAAQRQCIQQEQITCVDAVVQRACGQEAKQSQACSLPSGASATASIQETQLPTAGMLYSFDAIFNDTQLQTPLISCRVQQSSIRDALLLVAGIGKLDLVVDMTATGSVQALQCTDVSLGQVLRALCTSTQPRLAMVKHHEVWHVMAEQKAQLLAMQRATVQNNTSYRAYSHQLVHMPCNATTHKQVEQLWQQLVTAYDAKNTYMALDQQSKMVFFRAGSGLAQEFKRCLHQLDMPQPQVRIDVRVVVASKDFEESLGFDWSGVYNRRASVKHFDFVGVGPITNESNTESHQYFKDLITWSLNLIPTQITKTIQIPFVFGNNDLSTKRLNLLLNAAETRHEVKTILKPSLLVYNESCAQILVGQELPHEVRLDEAIEGKLSNVTTTNYKPVGIRLHVKPIIKPGLDLVMLEIYVENSSVAQPRIPLSNVSDGKQNSYGYTILTAQSRSTVQLKSGQTTMISGLLSNSKETDETGVPYLSKIPVLGWFFKGRSTARRDSQLLIFITPTMA